MLLEGYIIQFLKKKKLSPNQEQKRTPPSERGHFQILRANIILKGESQNAFHPKIKNKTDMYTVTTSVLYYIGCSIQCNKTEEDKERKANKYKACRLAIKKEQILVIHTLHDNNIENSFSKIINKNNITNQ